MLEAQGHEAAARREWQRRYVRFFSLIALLGPKRLSPPIEDALRYALYAGLHDLYNEDRLFYFSLLVDIAGDEPFSPDALKALKHRVRLRLRRSPKLRACVQRTCRAYRCVPQKRQRKTARPRAMAGNLPSLMMMARRVRLVERGSAFPVSPVRIRLDPSLISAVSQPSHPAERRHVA